MKVKKGLTHAWFTQGGTIVKATCEPSVEEKLVVVALDATEKALQAEPTPSKKPVIDWFKDERNIPNTPIGRWDRREP